MIMRLAFALLLLAPPCIAADLQGIPQFIDEMVAKHRFKRQELEQVFHRAQHRQAVIDAISLPFTSKPWPEYRANFINNQRIQRGLTFWQKHGEALKRAEWQYGVPQEIIVSVIGVETMYGRNSGRYSTLEALTTLAFDYPPRADFFRSELENYLLLAREQQWELFKIQGSYAGALGFPQFMPSSYLKYAEDFNNDNLIDLLNDPEDAIGSVGNYLRQYGWQRGEPVTVRANVSEKACAGSLIEARSLANWESAGVTTEIKVGQEKTAQLLDFTVNGGKEFWLTFNNFRVITLYNRSNFYAMSVYQLADALRSARGL